jgi:hypothetical protein
MKASVTAVFGFPVDVPQIKCRDPEEERESHHLPLALQTRGAKLPPVLRLQMSLEGLSRL